MIDNNDISIRKADIKDIEDIYNIQIASYPGQYHETQATLAGKLAKKNAICYVAICNNVIAGYLLSYPEEENYTSNLHEESLKDNNTSQKIFSIWYLHDIAVHPSFNGRNIAKKLYHIALEEAKTLNLKKSKLVAVQNAAAFWTKLGYQEIAKPDANAGYSSEATIMEKELI